MGSEGSVDITSLAKSLSGFYSASSACRLLLIFLNTPKINPPAFSIALILGFTIPRVPGFAFNGDTPLVSATGSWAKAVPTIFAPAYTNFSFPAFASLQVDTNSNFLPLKFNHLHASVYDLDTNRLIGTGNYAKISLPAKSFPDVLLPLNFTYVATNSSDQTCQFYLLSILNLLTPLIQTKTGTTAARTKVSSRMAYGPVSDSNQKKSFHNLSSS